MRSDSSQDSCRNFSSALARRDFFKITSLGVAASLTPLARVVAGPFEAADFEKLVPADKKLDPKWVESLFARGERTWYRGVDLEKIGMPIGGICAGQLYLGGDGKLWHWDIFNKQTKTNEDHYAHPLKPSSPLEQGFAVKISAGGKSHVRTLDRAGFRDVRFCGEYPIGFVEYRDADAPVEVSLEAFSPFIPLNADDSALPATVMQFTVKNTSVGEIEVEISGWLENAIGLYTSQPGEIERRTNVVRGNGFVFLEHTAALLLQHDTGKSPPIESRADFGTMGITLLGSEKVISILRSPPGNSGVETVSKKPIGTLARTLVLESQASEIVTFILTWHFPNHRLDPVKTSSGHRYAARFQNAREVAEYVAKNFERLASQTKLWHDTWLDSTLPHWLIDRAFLNTSILASSTCHWFSDGRFYAWEGVGCCPGTCTHVWHYAHAVARIFPQLERDLRKRTDFGLAFDEKTGVVRFRGEGAGLAIDGQAGVILRALREHQMSADDKFLRRNFPKIKRALQCLIEQPGGADGVLNGSQHNTLDTNWHGPVAWLNSLYLAALRAGEEMAHEFGDNAFAKQCAEIFQKGRDAHLAHLFNGEYFINKPDEKFSDAINSGTGCEIDQVMGQAWAAQIALGRVLPEKETRSALRALWRYNFTPDVGPYRAANKPGRWYAMPGEGGLLMCTFPRADWDFQKAAGKGPAFAIGYFNECMNGFEYQVAWHMIAEGMVMEGLAIARMVHDRYHASRRNPWNEVECGDHYARSMASYGVFLAACGFEHHGPRGHIGFAPRLTPENFRTPFTSAEGWGTFEQKIDGGKMTAQLAMKFGKLRVRSIALALPEKYRAGKIRVVMNGRDVEAKHTLEKTRLTIALAADANISANEKIEIEIG